jgi:hypothetical protein
MRATLQQYKEFLDSAMWADIKEILLIRRSSVRSDLEIGKDLPKDDLILWEERMRGRADELRFLADYPQYVADNYETLSKEEESDG